MQRGRLVLVEVDRHPLKKPFSSYGLGQVECVTLQASRWALADTLGAQIAY
jgi:hypothetical protein